MKIKWKIQDLTVIYLAQRSKMKASSQKLCLFLLLMSSWYCVFLLRSAKNAMSTIPRVSFFLKSESSYKPHSTTQKSQREGNRALRHDLKNSRAQLSNTLPCCLCDLKYKFLGKKEKGKLQILLITTDCLPLLLRLSRPVARARHLGSGAGKAAFTITPETYISSLTGKTEALADWRLCLPAKDAIHISTYLLCWMGPVTTGKTMQSLHIPTTLNPVAYWKSYHIHTYATCSSNLWNAMPSQWAP